jgi:cysteine desulfurase
MAAGERSYLDHNATSPMRPEVAEAVARAGLLPGNPSSVHAEGRAARAAIESAREAVAALVGGTAKAVIFTSGGTEANATILSPGLRRSGQDGAKRLLVGAAEHVSVLDGHRFEPEAVETVPVDRNGLVNLAWLAERLAALDGQPIVVSIQVANNETGVLQPVAEAARIVHEHGGLVHADAVQAAGKVPLDMAALGVDALTVSAHKLGGPKGSGAVILASDRVELGSRLIRGGGQERGARAGTENVAAIAGFGAAAGVALQALSSERERLSALRDEAEAHLRRIAPDAEIFGAAVERLPNTFAFAVPGLKAETALIAFDLDGVAVSSGSACSSGKVKPSHVLEAMGVDPALAQGALRVSLGWNTTREDVIRFAETCEKVVASLYKRRANAA